MSAIWGAIEANASGAPAFVENGVEISYGALVERQLARPRGLVDVVGTSSLEAATRILDAWRVGDAVLLLHPRVSDRECEEIRRDVRSAPLPDRCRAVVATSGTTGRRRYVLLSEDGMVASAEASASHLGWNDDDRWWLCMPLAHVGGLAILVRCLLAGRTVIVSERFDAASYQSALAAGATLMSMVPTMLHSICAAELGRPPDALRAILVGGSPCTPALAARARRLGLPALLTWGMSETGSQIATQALDARLSLAPEDLRCVGRPLPGFEVDLRNGVAWVRGPANALGYHPPERHPSPFDAEGWLETKDHVCRLDDGRLHILGRGSEMIVTGGENVYPAEVEATLTEMASVDAACVVGLPHEYWGQEVVAAVVGVPAGGEAAILAGVRDRLGGYKTPRRLFRMLELPTNANGKVDRGRLMHTLLALDASETEASTADEGGPHQQGSSLSAPETDG